VARGAGAVGAVFGIANYSMAGRGPHDFDALAAAILADVGDRRPSSFRVSATRADKRLPFTSPQVEREVGRPHQGSDRVARRSQPSGSDHPHRDAPGRRVLLFWKRAWRRRSADGTGGRVACLLSGGIDSPVAAYRLMRRGCAVLFIHFHSYPILSRASQEKVREIAELLTRYQLHSRLMLVPFGDLQQRVVLEVPPELRVVIYRRLMLRIAERIARRWHARALVTGEVIGQVASQTLENMATIADASTLEVLRPLVGMDKDEITSEAQRIGTYPISIIPDQDCCTLFTPRHPATRARVADATAAEQALPIAEMVDAAVEAASKEEFRYPVLT
jgi:thiamine biosynthesis protein ThiI